MKAEVCDPAKGETSATAVAIAYRSSVNEQL